YDNTVRIWDAEKASLIHDIKAHTDAVTAVAWSPDGKYVASASRDKTVRIWDAEKASLIHDINAHTNWVTAVAWSPDGKYVASASIDKTVRIWDTKTAAARRIIHFLPDHSWIALAADQRSILAAGGEAWRFAGWKIRDPRTGRIRILPLESPGPVTGLGQDT
ncbi:MAG: hypothetical protein RIT02_962, partial [Planctomycetota bacterium]